jgi:hypothetical protein
MKIKKVVVALLLVCTLVVGAFALSACIGNLTEQGEKTVTIIIVDAEGEVLFLQNHTTDELYLVGILNDFAGVGFNQTNGFVNYVIVNGEILGAGADEWVLMYSSSTDPLVSEPSWGSIVVNDVTYDATAFGVNQMPLRDGYTYVFAAVIF